MQRSPYTLLRVECNARRDVRMTGVNAEGPSRRTKKAKEDANLVEKKKNCFGYEDSVLYPK